MKKAGCDRKVFRTAEAIMEAYVDYNDILGVF